MVVNNMNLPFIVHMIPREDDLLSSKEGLSRGYGIGGPQRGTPFAAKVEMFASPLSLPCLKPPYGEMAVVDLTTQQIVWRQGNGPLNLGLPAAAGSFVTAGGLIFNAGVMDGRLRAFDTLTGEVIWQSEIGGSSDATPMSYVSPETGRQYVVVTVPGKAGPQGDPGLEGSRQLDSSAPTGGRVIAYALPD
jgi:quinate dehydrogenase (quinone)